jgi:hypothetical protein
MAGFFETLFGGGAEKEAADRDRALAAQYQTDAKNALQQGYNTGSQAINSAIGAYTPLANLGATYSSGAPTLMGALGIGTPEQVASARSSFSASPGYDFQLGQGLQAIARQRAIGGMGASGNADIDAMTYAEGLANQNYQQWLTNLMNTGQMGLSATSGAAAGQAAGYGSLADLAKAYGEDQTGVYGNTMQTNVGASNLQAAGEAAGAKNLLGAGLSLATLAMGGNPFGGALTGSAGMGSSLGNLTKNLGIGNLFMGGGSPSGYGA